MEEESKKAEELEMNNRAERMWWTKDKRINKIREDPGVKKEDRDEAE